MALAAKSHADPTQKMVLSQHHQLMGNVCSIVDSILAAWKQHFTRQVP